VLRTSGAAGRDSPDAGALAEHAAASRLRTTTNADRRPGRTGRRV